MSELLYDSLPWAFGPFVSGGMLLWGLVAVVPIVLHLLNRRRRQTVAWPAMQFLLEVLQKRSRNIQLWQWLLLLARLLAVLLLALALANPVLRTDATAVQLPSQQHLYVIDASYSMQTLAGSGESRFQAAMDAAIADCRSARPGDTFLVALMQADPIAVVSRPSADRAAVIDQLRALRPSFGPASLPLTTALVKRMLADTKASRSQLVFYSDMQRSTWQAAVTDPETVGWFDLQALGSELRVVDVTADDPATLENISLIDLQPRARDRVVLQVRAFDAASTASQWTVRVDGEVVQSNRLELAADGSGFAEVFLAETDQTSVIEASLEEDALQVDNSRWLVRSSVQTLRVLCLGKPAATRFLVAALRAGDQSLWDVRQLDPADFASANLDTNSIDLLMLCDLERMEPRINELIAATAARRGGVVWWLGARADPAGYASDAIPFRLAAVAEPDLYGVDPRSYEHPIASPFAPYPQSGLLSTPIFRYWRLAPLDPLTNPEVAIGLGADSDPLVLAMDNGHHRQAVVTSLPMTADTAVAESPWNAMVAWPSLVPLVQETAAWLCAPVMEVPALVVGEPLAGVAANLDETPKQVVAPDGKARPVITLDREPETASKRWMAGLADLPGIYQIVDSDGTSLPLAVNVDPLEADLRPIAATAMPQLVSSSATPSVDRTVDRQSESSIESESGGWFRWLIATAIGFLIVESLISRFALRWQA